MSEPQPDWFPYAACRGADLERFFPSRREPVAYAKSFCVRCEVVDECLAYAMAEPHLTGIWGGMSHRQRLRLTGRYVHK